MKSKIKNQLRLISLTIVAVLGFVLCSVTVGKAQCNSTLTISPLQPGLYELIASYSGPQVWYWWQYGDGNSDYGQNQIVNHIYSFPGTYYACVTTIDSSNGCTSQVCSWITVTTTICDITPQFTSIDMGGGTLMFTDASIDNNGYTINSWAWSFGDGGTSTQQNPRYLNFGIGGCRAPSECPDTSPAQDR